MHTALGLASGKKTGEWVCCGVRPSEREWGHMWDSQYLRNVANSAGVGSGSRATPYLLCSALYNLFLPLEGLVRKGAGSLSSDSQKTRWSQLTQTQLIVRDRAIHVVCNISRSFHVSYHWCDHLLKRSYYGTGLWLNHIVLGFFGI